MDRTDHDGFDGSELTITAEELDRERLRAYLVWGDVRAPRWYWPMYAALVTAWIASYALGQVWGTIGALAFAASLGGMTRVLCHRTGISTPRFRGMPPRLAASFLPLVVLVVLLVVGIFVGLGTPDAPWLRFALVAGPAMTLAGVGSSALYRRAAAHLAAEAGISR